MAIAAQSDRGLLKFEVEVEPGKWIPFYVPEGTSEEDIQGEGDRVKESFLAPTSAPTPTLEGPAPTLEGPAPTLEGTAPTLMEPAGGLHEGVEADPQRLSDLGEGVQAVISSFGRGASKQMSSDWMKAVTGSLDVALKKYGVPESGSRDTIIGLPDAISKGIDKAFPISPEYQGSFWWNTVPQGAGQVVGLAAVASTLGRLFPGLAANQTMALVAGATGVGRGWESATGAQADVTAMIGSMVSHGMIGMVDAIPVGRAFNLFNRSATDAAGGALQKTFFERLRGLNGVPLYEGVKLALLEGATEIGQEIGGDAVDKYWLNIESSMADTLERAMTAGGAGAVIGGLLGVVSSAIGGRRLRSLDKEVAGVVEEEMGGEEAGAALPEAPPLAPLPEAPPVSALPEAPPVAALPESDQASAERAAEAQRVAYQKAAGQKFYSEELTLDQMRAEAYRSEKADQASAGRAAAAQSEAYRAAAGQKFYSEVFQDPVEPTRETPTADQPLNEAQSQGYQKAKAKSETGANPSWREKVSGWANSALSMANSSEIEGVSRAGKNARFREVMGRNLGFTREIPEQTMAHMYTVIEGLTPAQRDLLDKVVVYRDAKASNDDGLHLPEWLSEGQGIDATLASLEAELARPENAPVITALQRRAAIYKTVTDHLEKQMIAVGRPLPANWMRKDYFPHIISEYNSKRHHSLKKRAGSDKLYDTSTPRADAIALQSMAIYAANLSSIQEVRTHYDRSSEVEAGGKIPEHLSDHTWWAPIQEDYKSTMANAEVFTDDFLYHHLKSLGLTDKDQNTMRRDSGASSSGAMFIPTEIANALDSMNAKPSSEFYKTYKTGLDAWKRYHLIGPLSLVKYNVRNAFGDSDAVIAGEPRVFYRVPQAMRDLYDYYYRGMEPSDMLRRFLEGGGASLTIQAQELGGIQAKIDPENASKFESMMAGLDPNNASLMSKAWNGYWTGAKELSDFRETVLRLAAYSEFHSQLTASRASGVEFSNFAASSRESVLGLRDPDTNQGDIDAQAFWLSNDLLGAYNHVGQLGQWFRNYGVLPFWSFQEVNIRRYSKLIKNALKDPNAPLKAAKVAGLAGKNISLYALWRSGGLLLKMGAMQSLLSAYNHWVHGESEEALPERVQSSPHLIWGKDDRGHVAYIDRLGAFGDFLEWFGMEDSPRMMAEFLSGRRSAKETVKEMLSWDNLPLFGGIIKKGESLINPLPKWFLASYAGLQTWPDALDPRGIRDKWKYAFDQFGLGEFYKMIADVPRDKREAFSRRVFYNSIDPNRQRYWNYKSLENDFKDKIGKGYKSRPPTQRQNAAYYAKEALVYGDEALAKKYIKEYLELALPGAAKQSRINNMPGVWNANKLRKNLTSGFYKSIEAWAPGSFMNPEEQNEFMATLDSDGKALLDDAVKYYGTYVLGNFSKGIAKALKGMKFHTKQGLEEIISEGERRSPLAQYREGSR